MASGGSEFGGEGKLRARAAIRGGFAGDAAALGLFWQYMPDVIDTARGKHGGEVAFLIPDRDNYPPRTGFFAHPGKVAGDNTQYGRILLNEVESFNGSSFDAAKFRSGFSGLFGFGGTYSGWVDGGMKETMVNWYHAEKDGKEDVKNALEAGASFGSGRDLEMNALARLVPLVAVLGRDRGAVLSAVAQTQYSPQALAWVVAAFELLANAIEGVSVDENVAKTIATLKDIGTIEDPFKGIDAKHIEAAGLPTTLAEDIKAAITSEDIVNILQQAFDTAKTDAASKDQDPLLAHRAYVASRGLSCPLKFGVPITVHAATLFSTLDASTAYESAVRATIAAAGNSAGRGILIGAVLAASNPAKWHPASHDFYAKCTLKDDLDTAIGKALDA